MRYLNTSLFISMIFISLTAQAVLQIPAPKDVSKAPTSAVTFIDGINYVVLEKGSGKLASKQYVRSLATAWTSIDGKTRFSAKEDGADVTDPDSLTAMTPGLAQALKATPIGERRRWWIAAKLMKPGWGGMIQGNYTVDIKVLDQMDPIKAPANLSQAPANAITTPTGLKYLVVKKGLKQAKEKRQKPTHSNTVRAHYSGWTTDGNMFDSSVLRGKPLEFELGRVIKGWQEGLTFMSVGDKYRFWIPVNLAYGANPRPGAPKGDLVFDVELMGIVKK
ncbi:MAG: hypothetical protein ACI8WB_002411 [Phenylobacterium sp.]|jgi:hypothetical protein